MLDLPNHSVLMGGLDYWFPLGEEIAEPRLAAKLCRLLDVPPCNCASRRRSGGPDRPHAGIKAWQFPEWFITQDVRLGADQPHVRSRLLVHRRTLQKASSSMTTGNGTRWCPCASCAPAGRGTSATSTGTALCIAEPTECRRPLWIDERGTSGDLAEVYVRCECGQERSMTQAAVLRHWALGPAMGPGPGSGRTRKKRAASRVGCSSARPAMPTFRR